MGGTGIELVPPSHAVAGSGDSCHLADEKEPAYIAEPGPAAV
jgi:hypothetical protein